MAGRIPIATIQKTTLIYNPFAGGLKRRIERLLPRTLHILNETGLRVSAIPTTGPRQAGVIARYAVENGSDLILALGGDGTINEVVNGMAHSGVPLGILPGGTANVLASELGIGRSVELAAALIAQSVPRRVSLGLLRCENAEPRYFVMMAGAGLDAKIVYNLNLTLKGAAGKLAYYLSGFAQLGSRLAEFPVRSDDHSSLASFALASRVRNYGGDLEIARGASLYHDHFELVLFHGSNSLRYLKYLAGVATRRLERTEGVSILRAIQVAFGPGVPIQVDGEYAGRTPATIEISSQALTLLVPPAFHEKESALARAAAGEWITLPTR